MNKERVDAPVICTLCTGLANRTTEARRIPQKYMEKTVLEVLRYLERVIERDGTSEDKNMMASIHDQMRQKKFVIMVNNVNVDQDAAFDETVRKVSEVKDAGGEDMKYREVNIIITSVEEGG